MLGKWKRVLVGTLGKQMECDQREKGLQLGDRMGEPEFFESDGDLYAIGSLGCVEIDIGRFLG